jgi:hypothetical protein
MPNAATVAKRAAAKRAREADDAALRERLAAAAAAADEAMAAAAQPSLSLADKTMDIVNPSTQDDDGRISSRIDDLQSPPRPSAPRLLGERSHAEPVRASVTPQGRNVELVLEAPTPGGTLQQETYKRAVATPEGEDEEARVKRLAMERARLARARARLDAKVQTTSEMRESSDELDAALDRLTKASSDAAAEQVACEVRHTYEEYIRWRDDLIEKLTINQVYHIAEARGKHRERLLTAVSVGKTVHHEQRKAELAEGCSSMGIFISLGGEAMHQSDGGLRWERFVGLNQQTGSYQYETVRVDDGWGEMSCTASFRKLLKQMSADPESTVALPHPDQQRWQEVYENRAACTAALKSWRQAEHAAGRDGLTKWERYDREMAARKACEYCKGMYCFRGLKCPSR